ncbi:hypothetical protein T439DRAFT_329247 [Meredithblackwellia eburnea MCA 4105]
MSTLFSPSEVSYTTVPLSTSSTRADGRSPFSYRDIILETDVSPQALGSARCVVGDGAGLYSEVWVGVKGDVGPAEMELNEDGEGAGKILISVECAPTALPSLTPDFPQHLSQLLTTLFSPSALPQTLLSQLLITPHSKSWHLTLNILVLSSSGGNILDLALIAARSALASTRLPTTRPVQLEDEDRKGETGGGFAGLVKGGKGAKGAKESKMDFELVNAGWDEGKRLVGWKDLPVGLSLNLINQLPHLDSTVLEETASTSQLVACFNTDGSLCAAKQLGSGEVEMSRLVPLLREAQKFAKELREVLNSKLE